MAAGGNFAVFDVSSPTSPQIASTLPVQGTAYGIALSGSYACLATRNDGVRIYDVSTPSAPLELGVFRDTLGDPEKIAVSGTHALVTEQDGGGEIFDLSGC